MSRLSKPMLRTILSLGCACLASCATERGPQNHPITMSSEDLSGIVRLYEKATAHRRRAVRKPIRDEQARAMWQLAEEAERVLAETQTRHDEALFVSLASSQRDQARQDMAGLRESLIDLRDAAHAKQTTRLPAAYAQVMASYQKLTATTGSGGETE